MLIKKSGKKEGSAVKGGCLFPFEHILGSCHIFLPWLFAKTPMSPNIALKERTRWIHGHNIYSFKKIISTQNKKPILKVRWWNNFSDTRLWDWIWNEMAKWEVFDCCFHYNPLAWVDRILEREREHTACCYECCHSSSRTYCSIISVQTTSISCHWYDGSCSHHTPFTSFPEGKIKRKRSKEEHWELPCANAGHSLAWWWLHRSTNTEGTV